MRYILYIVVMVVALSGCFKDEDYDTLMIFTPTEQVDDSSDAAALDGVLTYAFVADTTDYGVLSYEDALRGVVTDKLTGEELLPISIGEPMGNDAYQLSMAVSEPSVMLVAVDTKNEDYAYTNYSVGMNLATTYIALPFHPYKEVNFSVGSWYYVVPEAIIVETDETEEDEE